jgi:hypothetical protein
MLKDQGLSETELKAVASWTKHSSLTQSKVYDQQNKTKRKMLKDQGLSETELEAAASWMKHSRLT